MLPRRDRPGAVSSILLFGLLFGLLGATLIFLGGCGRSGSKPAEQTDAKAAEALPSKNLPAEKPPSAGAVADSGATTNVSLDCASVVSHMRSVMMGKLSRIPGATVPLERALTVASNSCETDNWPEPLRRCLTAVQVMRADGKNNASALWDCVSFVPPEMREKIEPKLRSVL